MDTHSSGSAKPSQIDGGYPLDTVTIFSELCSAVMALQAAAVDDCPETFSNSNAKVRLYVRQFLQIKSELQSYLKLRMVILSILETVLSEEHEYVRAVSRSLDSLPDHAIGDEEADPPI